MPAFRRRETSAAILGRLLAGYGELELLLAFCVGRPTPRVYAEARSADRGHRNHREIKPLTTCSRARRIQPLRDGKEAHEQSVCRGRLEGRLHRDNGRDASVPRNQEPLCALSLGAIQKRGLFFINLEDAAVAAGPLNLNAFRHADPKTLARLEDYFWYTFQCLDYLAKALAVKTKVMLGPAPPRPQRKPRYRSTTYFPLKSFH